MIRFLLVVALGLSVNLNRVRSDSPRPDEIRLEVDVDNPTASDSNDGTTDNPLKSISAAVSRAVAYKKAGVASRIVIHPGIYREGPIRFGFTNWRTNDPGNNTPITVEALEIGTVFVRGSEEFTGWQATATDGVFAHPWDYRWGVAPNPWAGDREVADIVLRREMLFVDGGRFDQVLSRDELAPGSFFVDEVDGLVLVALEPGVLPADHLIELAVRSRLWDQNFENNVTIRGLVFEHAATPWDPADAAVWISGSRNVTLDACKILNTNWQGLYVGESSGVSILSSELNDNGGQGWGMFRVSHLEAIGNQTSRNNWRGKLGGFDGWSVGNKLLSVHQALIREHTAVDNYSRGLWLDYDISSVVLDKINVSHNSGDGIWIEASQGPVTIKNSVIADNAESGIRSTYSRLVVVDSNRIAGNATAQIEIDGSGTRTVRNFTTRQDLALTLRGWVVTHNEISGPVAIATGQVFRRSDWSEFLAHLVVDENRYSRAGGEPSFRILRGSWTFEDWRSKTGQDQRSQVLF